MPLISISGTPCSRTTELATVLAHALHVEVGVDKDIVIDAMSWYDNPKSYSIFCMQSIDNDTKCKKWEEVRRDTLVKYAVDLEDMRNYDLVIDTSFYASEAIFDTILTAYRNKLRGAIVCGVQCLPTEPAIDMSIDVFESVQNYKVTPGTPTVTYRDGNWFILDGHARMYGNPYVAYLCHVKDAKVEPNKLFCTTYDNIVNFHVGGGDIGR